MKIKISRVFRESSKVIRERLIRLAGPDSNKNIGLAQLMKDIG
jgi:hypothetical protein